MLHERDRVRGLRTLGTCKARTGDSERFGGGGAGFRGRMRPNRPARMAYTAISRGRSTRGTPGNRAPKRLSDPITVLMGPSPELGRERRGLGLADLGWPGRRRLRRRPGRPLPTAAADFCRPYAADPFGCDPTGTPGGGRAALRHGAMNRNSASILCRWGGRIRVWVTTSRIQKHNSPNTCRTCRLNRCRLWDGRSSGSPSGRALTAASGCRRRIRLGIQDDHARSSGTSSCPLPCVRASRSRWGIGNHTRGTA